MTYKEMTIDYIIDWCKENNQIEWLKAENAKTFPVEGTTKKGKPKKPRKITLLEIKRNFVEKFMPELLPQEKPKKETFRDKIANL